MTESAGTLIEAAISCREEGTAKVQCAISHGCFTDVGYQRLVEAFSTGLINKLFVSNSVNFKPFPLFKDLVITVDVAPWFAVAIKNIHNNESVSELFK